MRKYCSGKLATEQIQIVSMLLFLDYDYIYPTLMHVKVVANPVSGAVPVVSALQPERPAGSDVNVLARHATRPDGHRKVNVTLQNTCIGLYLIIAGNTIMHGPCHISSSTPKKQIQILYIANEIKVHRPVRNYIKRSWLISTSYIDQQTYGRENASSPHVQLCHSLL